jgi:hypothetical protein
MIKLGIFADQTTNKRFPELLSSLPEVEISGLYFSGNASFEGSFNVVASPLGLMDVSDAILILGEQSISHDLVKLILRKSKPVYLKSVPNLNIREIKELVDLEKEAGIVASFYNPFTFNPYFDPLVSKYEKPFLINLRTSFETTTVKPSKEMLLLITTMNQLVQSNYKKLDVFGTQKHSSDLTVNVRLEYENGCVVNLTQTLAQEAGFCEIFQLSGNINFKFKKPLYVQYSVKEQEFNSVKHFIRAVQSGNKKFNFFDDLMTSVQIVHQIKEHLKFNGIDF